MQSAKEIGELLFGPIQHILREEAAAGAEFNHRDLFGSAQSTPHLVELARQQATENRMDIARGIEVAGLAELRGVARVVAEFVVVQAQLHVAREGNRAVLANLLLDLLAESVHSPFRWRSARSCGVRMNISMK
jgi:hypothetical protein